MAKTACSYARQGGCTARQGGCTGSEMRPAMIDEAGRLRVSDEVKGRSVRSRVCCALPLHFGALFVVHFVATLTRLRFVDPLRRSPPRQPPRPPLPALPPYPHKIGDAPVFMRPNVVGNTRVVDYDYEQDYD